MHVRQGDIVRYIGSDPRIQRDYGDRDLVVIDVDSNCLTICQNQEGNLLVGVYCNELEIISSSFDNQTDAELDS
ncbi:hypothetical protein H6F67_15395 [Microcoleus sp. FACHB-1515]|uniref:hypothetical protein n=1 Tax=Cyanophyceae TaxID=3028117 RepID=UPI0016847C7B|nr:hypothetical protein [Microcoleus sp. FACHB-1515]MBD2091239.1 hypothetical protein [Microcoleus sp. FACHB-1515]